MLICLKTEVQKSQIVKLRHSTIWYGQIYAGSGRSDYRL